MMNNPWEDCDISFLILLRELNIIKVKYVSGSYKDDVNECIKAIIYLYNLNKKPPTTSEYDEYAKIHNLTRRRNLEKKLGRKWSEICQEHIGESNQYEKNKEEIYNELLSIKKALGRTPMAIELKEYGFNFKQCYRAFDMTYNQVIKSFGWSLSGRNPVLKTDKELLDDYIELYEELGRIPMYIDIDRVESMASSQTYKRRIGDVREICNLCNIEINNESLFDLNISCGDLFLDKNNEICLSYPELLISNFLIENGFDYIKEYKYCNVIPNEDPRRRFDWYLKDYNVFIEYFGLFDIDSIDEDNWKGKYTRKALDKIDKCKINKINLITLYPEDIENELSGIKNKILSHVKKYHKTVSVETMCS